MRHPRAQGIGAFAAAESGRWHQDFIARAPPIRYDPADTPSAVTQKRGHPFLNFNILASRDSRGRS